ncbi:MAG: bifunctional adenosylcobinamide kinase/adenosylcobinamide-phosphate guanylyltransferase, partial [Actinomycetia bacterium]|nr:bifunctional adenosylcobinamide kinase/adenosylcobinamide-phosphate guanylyltransferase [Actinomycetes bacterium]
SGKSLAAERLLDPFGDVCYVATGGRDPQDPEWQARIAEHIDRRPQAWRTVETTAIADELRRAAPGTAILVDCLTLWVNRTLFPDGGGAANPTRPGLEQELADLTEAVRECRAEVVLVTNEVGSGIVPDNAQSRAFQDALGVCNAAVAAACDQVFMYVAGCRLTVKGGEHG